MTFKICLLGCIASLFGFSAVSMADGQDSSRLGIVDAKPDDGPFVKIDQGYMVPYEVTIPGTNVTFEMVPVPAGRFEIGSPDDEPGRDGSEGPQITVMMEPFWMGKYEVTWKEYRSFMGVHDAFKEFSHEGIRRITEEREIDVVTSPSLLYDTGFTYEGGEGPDTPAVTMTQYAAKQYTKWLSLLGKDFYRLPSEAEWEYACRAGTSTAYSFGDDPSMLDEFAWFEANSNDQRQDVGTKLPNPWGLYDMHGNVAEWVLDSFTEDGYTAIGGGMVAPLNAIQWPDKLYPRVARGGSWEMSPTELRSAARLASDETWKDSDPCIPQSPWWHTTFPATGVGFRLVRPLSSPESAEEKEKFWGAMDEELEEDVGYKIEYEGRGARGYVDPELPNAIRRLQAEKGD